VIPYGLLDKVNFTVNKYLTYRPDGIDTSWKPARETEESLRGDCEDFAIVKASRLVRFHGQNPDDMAIGICTFPNQTAHAILICKSEKTTGFFRRKKIPCEYVLDNRTNGIYEIDQTRLKIATRRKVDAYI
jgi:predicted transglutaminase-like cysteine proteinase